MRMIWNLVLSLRWIKHSLSCHQFALVMLADATFPRGVFAITLITSYRT